MEFLDKKSSRLTAGVLLSLLFFYVGWRAGEERVLRSTPPTIVNTSEGAPANVDFSPFWKTWNILNEKFVPASTSKAVTSQDEVWGAIRGLTSSLGDPYTIFFPPVESELFASDIRGNFEGVGMEVVAQGGALTVIAPLKGSPADIAGVRSGDRIIKIDGKDTSNLSTEEAIQKIRGPKGSKVVFTIIRAGKKGTFEITVTRDVINIPTIDEKKLPNGIFDISLYSFSEDSPNLFRGALRDFVLSGDGKLILDLRGNPGGYLEAAIDMASWFLPSGKVVVRENFGPGKEETVYRSKGYDVFSDKLKFVILVDGGSASASEILAGALSEQGKAVLIGQKTFGKGSVQELVEITPKTTLKVTIAHWLTPNGRSISQVGITPDIVVERTDADITAGKDPQLDRAVEFLNTGK